MSPFVAVVRSDSRCLHCCGAVDTVLFVVDIKVEVVVVSYRCLGSITFGLFLLAEELKALMAYDEDTEENASESNEDQDQASVVAATKDK